LAEGGVGWIPATLRLMDHFWEDNRKWIQPQLEETPSFYFKRNFWATFEDDRAGVLTRHLMGLDRLMWGSDYPHSEGTFPYSRRQIEHDFGDIPEQETRMLVRDNAAQLYGIEV
jgi:predicted TIM-barrel fold metal-dependent hydrolase